MVARCRQRALPHRRRPARRRPDRRRRHDVLRTLETLRHADGSLARGGETRLFVTPGFRFRVVDLLLTNFHLPRSTLFMLVAAFAGLERIKARLRPRDAERFRFFSYGDACLSDRADPRLSRASSCSRRTVPPAAAGSLPRSARRDAGLHAGRHRRHREGDDLDMVARHRRRDRASATPTT